MFNSEFSCLIDASIDWIWANTFALSTMFIFLSFESIKFFLLNNFLELHHFLEKNLKGLFLYLFKIS
ncbi:hypothetical protein [Ureaplasma diversum]|uniref:hypothetical protein n=1 Tax=Ureaplasma diversum TaxID=42094 RepID=UPI001FD01ECB|nr:hypothetical protein [Ureaplasma diversum]